jgi:hypothetical protein
MRVDDGTALLAAAALMAAVGFPRAKLAGRSRFRDPAILEGRARTWALPQQARKRILSAEENAMKRTMFIALAALGGWLLAPTFYPTPVLA